MKSTFTPPAEPLFQAHHFQSHEEIPQHPNPVPTILGALRRELLQTLNPTSFSSFQLSECP